MRTRVNLIFLAVLLFTPISSTQALDTVTAALTSKAFQYVPLVIAQERGYMKEEGLDLKMVYMQNAVGLQALIANQVQFSGSGSNPTGSHVDVNLCPEASLPQNRG